MILNVAASSLFLYSQSGKATLTGTVFDSTGAVIPGAELRVTNTATGVVKTAVANEAGLYVIPDLTPGCYTLEVTVKGFRAKKVSDIQLVVDQQAQLDVALEPGSLNQEVTVSAAPALLQTVDSSVGSVINVQQTVNLPLNGRYFSQLLELAPGTVASTRSARFWAPATQSGWAAAQRHVGF